MNGLSEADKNMLGLVQVYTGIGKGKTTASLGLCFRAAGRGLNVLMIQFMKPPEDYGEHISATKFDNIEILPMGPDHFIGGTPGKEDIGMAKEAFDRAKKEIYSGKYDLVVLDEINNAMGFGLLNPKDVVTMLGNRPENIEIVMTGRNAPAEIIDFADLVTEMKLVKHPFDKGICARKGIEY